MAKSEFASRKRRIFVAGMLTDCLSLFDRSYEFAEVVGVKQLVAAPHQYVNEMNPILANSHKVKEKWNKFLLRSPEIAGQTGRQVVQCM